MSLSRKSIKIYLLFVLFLGLYSCAPKVLNGLEKQTLNQSVSLASMIDYQENGQANYRCKIDAFEQHISGMMIFKKTEQNRRVVMMTDFGLKVIDISYDNEGGYVINYIMKHFDYKFIRESFALNIAMLLQTRIPQGNNSYQRAEDWVYYAPPVLFFQKDQQTLRVERYRGKNKCLAIAEMQKNAVIRIQQNKPEISIKLIPVN